MPTLGILMVRWLHRAEQPVEGWAQRNSDRASKALVYAVKVADPEGTIRCVRLTAGSSDMGVLTGQVSVEWEH